MNYIPWMASLLRTKISLSLIKQAILYRILTLWEHFLIFEQIKSCAKLFLCLKGDNNHREPLWIKFTSNKKSPTVLTTIFCCQVRRPFAQQVHYLREPLSLQKHGPLPQNQLFYGYFNKNSKCHAKHLSI